MDFLGYSESRVMQLLGLVLAFSSTTLVWGNGKCREIKSCWISIRRGYRPHLFRVRASRFTGRSLFSDLSGRLHLNFHFGHTIWYFRRYFRRMCLVRDHLLLMLRTSEWACRRDRKVCLEGGLGFLAGNAPNGGRSSRTLL